MNNKDELKLQIDVVTKQLTDRMDEIDELTIKLKHLREKLREEDDDYMKCECLNCDGVGWYKDDNRKKICETCDGKRYMWVKKFK